MCLRDCVCRFDAVCFVTTNLMRLFQMDREFYVGDELPGDRVSIRLNILRYNVFVSMLSISLIQYPMYCYYVALAFLLTAIQRETACTHFARGCFVDGDVLLWYSGSAVHAPRFSYEKEMVSVALRARTGETSWSLVLHCMDFALCS